LIQEYGGADYFDQDRSTPFKYATVLFCCQRYGDAISHLWVTGKTIPAVHLTVVCLHYGLILPFLPLNQNPYHSMAVNGSNNFGGYNHSMTTANEPSPSIILNLFVESQSLQHFAGIKVDYLMSLDSNWLMFVENFGLDNEIKETSCIKSQSTVNSALEQLILSLNEDNITIIAGNLFSDSYISSQG
jgi:hypothetical protein